jgi:hypothetical protein
MARLASSNLVAPIVSVSPLLIFKFSTYVVLAVPPVMLLPRIIIVVPLPPLEFKP